MTLATLPLGLFLASACTPVPDASDTAGVNEDSGSEEPTIAGLVVSYDVPVVAVLGAYGLRTAFSGRVAELVDGVAPDLIITTGGNNLPDGDADSLDDNIGRNYHAYLYPYAGEYGDGAVEPRFFPALDDADWSSGGTPALSDWIELPGNGRYYDFVWGAVHFFCVDSAAAEPDGNTAESPQAAWLEQALGASASPFQVVYLHHAPYSSGALGSVASSRWDFRGWGADLVLAGSETAYERLHVDGLPYVVIGTGGSTLERFQEDPAEGSQAGIAEFFGAGFLQADDASLQLDFYTLDGGLMDQLRLRAGQDLATTITPVPRASTWSYWDKGTDPGQEWTATDFDDSAWSTGAAPLGVGADDLATTVQLKRDGDVILAHYFRLSFDGSGRDAWRDARLLLRRDDGAVVYLNGGEVLRDNMPEGMVGPTTRASETQSGGDEEAYRAFSLDLGPVVDGENVLAVEVHQSSDNSSDLAFDLGLEVALGSALVASGDEWLFLDDGQPPGDDWTTPGFDDASWSAGPSPLGYDADEATTVGYGSDVEVKHLSTWFRHSFDVSDAAAVDHLLLRLRRDDGAAVFLNGHPVYRSNLPGPDALDEGEAVADVEDWFEERFLESAIDAGLLVDGTNVLAVEVRQERDGSSDLIFDLELVVR
jgi:hypothetical protein